MKILKESIEASVCDLELGSHCLSVTPKGQITKEKIGSLNIIKIENFVLQGIESRM